MKYEITDICINFENKTLYRIKALKNFRDVNKGDLGGFVEHSSNLSQLDTCWIYDNAKVFGNAEIYCDAIIQDNAIVSGDAKIYNDVIVSDDARITDNVKVWDNAIIRDKAFVKDTVTIFNHSIIEGFALVQNRARIYNNAKITGHAVIQDSAEVLNNSIIQGAAIVQGSACIKDNMIIAKDSVVSCDRDVLYIRNNWSSGRGITYTLSNNMYATGCFVGNAEQLLHKAKEDDDALIVKGLSKYEQYKFLIDYVNNMYNLNNN